MQAGSYLFSVWHGRWRVEMCGVLPGCAGNMFKRNWRRKTFSLESLLKDPELAQACHMAHFFALVGKERTYILHELKDREFVKWLLDHPEAFENWRLPGHRERIRWLY